MKAGEGYVDLGRKQSTIGRKLQKHVSNMFIKKSKPKVETTMVQPIIALYKVTSLGGLQRTNQTDVKMGRKFFPSLNGNMMLTRSKDKKVVSLTNFDRESTNGDYFKTLAWTIKLKVFETADEFELLNSGMNQYFNTIKDTFDELIEVSFVGNSKFVQLVYMEAKPRTLVE